MSFISGAKKMWFRKKNETTLNSSEYESLAKKLTSISSKLEEVELKHKILQTDYNNLRGNFNRRLKGLSKESSEMEESEQEQDINKTVLLPEDGAFKHNRFGP